MYEDVVKDGQIVYWQKNPHKKEVVILLHGFPGNHLGLLALANNLGDTYRIIIPNLPSCGKTEELKEHTLKNYSKWLHLFMEKLEIDNAFIVGHSFGARVALVFAVNYSKKVRGLVFITPVIKFDGLLAYLATIHYKIAELLPSNLGKTWLSNQLYQRGVGAIVIKSDNDKKRQEIMEKNLEEAKNLNVRAHVELFDEFYRFNLSPLGKEIHVKSLVIAGDKDNVSTLDSVQELVNELPNASFKIIKNAGHLVPIERPVVTAGVIRQWLRKDFK